LLQKNGIVKVYWDDERQVNSEEYENLTEEELALDAGGRVCRDRFPGQDKGWRDTGSPYARRDDGGTADWV
jgi:hypothetical protein